MDQLRPDPRDEGDIAADYQSRHNAAALARHRQQMERELASPGSDICEDCGSEIPAGRREAKPGCRLCLECATLHERLKGGM
jgi:phage/conjugal plasmid C-4 type zinc finger TraR family protein